MAKKTTVLVVGGIGYIGSHAVRELVDTEKGQKYQVVVVDNQSTGHPASLPANVAFEKADLRDKASLDAVFKKHHIDAVMHFGASISVAESVSDPLGYYENNVTGTLNLLTVMRDNSVKLLIFSSTAAIFGMPENASIQAEDSKAPINPYGETKLAVEKCLRWCDEAYGIKYVCLRYFNACGAHRSGEIGEDHQHETHLVPLILHVALGKRSQIKIFGDDYPTEDGTCVRDYVHVTDLATAHIKALEYIQAGNPSDCFNLGSGTGYSVLQIIEAARKVTQHPIPSVKEARRPGDPPALVACSKKAEKLLGWERQYKDIESIVETAWRFHKQFPNGYTS